MAAAAPDSLRRKLLGRLGGLVSLVVLLGGASTFALAVHFANGVFDQWLFDSASTLATQVRASAGTAQMDLPASAVEMFEFDTLDRVYYDVTADGQRIFGNAALPAAPETALRRDARGLARFFDTEVQGKPVRAVSLEVAMPAGHPGTVIIRVAETTNKRDRLVTQILLSSLLPQVILLLLAALATWYAVNSALRSVEQVTEGLTGYRPGGVVSLPDPVSAPEEVRPLLAALHDLVDKLNEAQDSQQRFIANASHQLRTPLAALQVQVERALREPDPVKHSAALHSVLKSLTRMRHLSHQLLMLARAEPPGKTALMLRPLDLASLVRDELENWTGPAIAAGADLGYDGPSTGTMITGEPQLLRELIGNLVDNAIRYSGPGARITVSVRDSPAPTLLVDDEGPGIPEAERSLVLERFYRRAQGDSDGAGLGLSIAREIVARHAATLRVESPPYGRGTRMVIAFASTAHGEPAPTAA